MGNGQHEMRLERTHASGEEEWFCPHCGRRFLLNWPPVYSKVIIEPGDEHTIHIGAKGGLVIPAPSLDTSNPLDSDHTFFQTVPDRTDTSPDEQASELSFDLLRPWAKLLGQPAPEHFR